jgi:GT2 family glycosyltransferase
MPAVTLSIIIHQDFSHIHRALTSIVSQTDLPLVIHLTLNAGDAAQMAAVQDAFPQVQVCINPEPRGFAENHNRVLRLAETDYVLLLNDDIEAPPHMIDRIVAFMEAHSTVGLVSPRVLNPDGSAQLMAFSDPTLPRMVYKLTGLGHLTRQGSAIRRWLTGSPLFRRLIRTASLQTYEQTRDVPVVVGVAMCVRRAAYQQAGLIDEDTRVYGEEYGWHWRLRQHGWRVVLLAETFITHFNTDQPLEGWKLAEHRKGMLSYFIRYRSRGQAFALRAAMFTLHTLRAGLCLIFAPRRARAEWGAARVALTFQPRR